MTGMTDLHWPKHSCGRLAGLHIFASLSGTADTLLTSSVSTGPVIFELFGVLRARDSLAFSRSLASNHARTKTFLSKVQHHPVATGKLNLVVDENCGRRCPKMGRKRRCLVLRRTSSVLISDHIGLLRVERLQLDLTSLVGPTKPLTDTGGPSACMRCVHAEPSRTQLTPHSFSRLVTVRTETLVNV